jgi:DNA-nicking Smr family endonuclease
MDFGDILNEWEHIKRERKESPAPDAPRADVPAKSKPESSSMASPKAPPKAKPSTAKAFEAWLDAHDVEPKDADREADLAVDRDRTRKEARELSSMKSQDVLDLHGMTAEEASAAIDAFLQSSSLRGLSKVLVIHGKGLHSDGAPVLKKAARRAIESSRLAGRFGEAAKDEGGSGAMWVMIRRGR